MGYDVTSTINDDAQEITDLRSLPKRPRISPLRYPGGKAALFQPLASLIRRNGVSDGTYVEPYAGGAGAGLALLITGQVKRIVINDLDPAVYAFWKATTCEPERFRALVAAVELSVVEWQRQREIYVEADLDNYLKLGFAFFYLNRTNRSGVLNAGPIGGLDQTGNYKIDARFTRSTLDERLRLIALHRDKIRVFNEDGLSVIKRYAHRKNTLIYADPPYFTKAGTLYMNSFKMEDHVALARVLNDRAHRKWILTYDNAPSVHDLYSERRRVTMDLNYSVRNVVKANEIGVYSDGLLVD